MTKLTPLATRQLRLYSFDRYGTECVAVRLANRSPTRPTKFCLMQTVDAARWYQLSNNSGSFYWSVNGKAVAHNYTDRNAAKGKSVMLLNRFVTKAPGNTFCRAKNKQPLDLRPDQWIVYEHPRGNPLTVVEQLQAKAEREHGLLPDVTLLSRLVEPDRLDFSTWTVRP